MIVFIGNDVEASIVSVVKYLCFRIFGNHNHIFGIKPVLLKHDFSFLTELYGVGYSCTRIRIC